MRARLLACLLLLSAPTGVQAAVGTSGVETWYSVAGCTFNGDGLAQTCAASAGASGAFNSNTSIIWTATTGVDNGDTIYICGAHVGDSPAPTNGTAGLSTATIKIRYDCPGNPGSVSNIVTMTEALTAGNWTSAGTNIWYLSLASYTWQHPRRVWKDGVELFPADQQANLGTQVNGGTPVSTWWYDQINDRLYLYSVGNPATGLTSLKSLVAGSGTCSYATLCLNGSGIAFIDIINPTMQAGNFASMYILGAHDITIFGTASDNTACNIGKDTLRGLLISDTNGDGTGTAASNITVYQCTLDPIIPTAFADYRYEWNSGLGDGIHVLDGANAVTVWHTTVRSFPHAQINIVAVEGTTLISGITIRDSIFTCADQVAYCRWFAVDGDSVGRTTGVLFERMIMTRMSIRSQFNGNGNTLRASIMGDVRDDVVVKNGTSHDKNVMVEMETYAGTSQDNTMENVTMYGNSYAPCVSFRNGAFTNSGHTLRNSVLYGCGSPTYTAIAGGANAAIHKPTGANLGNDTFANNVIYSAGTTTTIGYKGSNYTVSAWQAACSGDTCTGNLSGDPLFLNYPTNLRPGVGSPARGAGQAYTGCTDVLGRVCFSPPTIGAYQIASPDGASSRWQ